MKTLNMKLGMTSRLASLSRTEKLRAYLRFQKLCLAAWSLLFSHSMELSGAGDKQELSWCRDVKRSGANCPALRWTQKRLR